MSISIEKIGRYCVELTKTLQVEDTDSERARAIRKKILRMLLEFEKTSEDVTGLELFWRVAYREPAQAILKAKFEPKVTKKLITEFTNELRLQMHAGTKHAAFYNIYIGDLHRYMGSNSTLIRAFYKKAISIEPDLGHAFNQLALTDTHLMALRHWLMALAVTKPFQPAFKNVQQTLSEKFDTQMEEKMVEFVKLILINFSKTDMQLKTHLWVDFLDDLEDIEEQPSLPLLLDILSIAASLAPNYMGYDVFLEATQLVAKSLLILLPKIRAAVDVDLEINIHRVRRRRMILTEEEEDESNEETTKGKENEIAKEHEENLKDAKKKDVEYLLLATACEWLYHAHEIIRNGLEKSDVPIPSAFRDLYDGVLDILIEKLNGLVETFKKHEEDVDEELSWLVYGPTLEAQNGKSQRPLKQLIYWAYQLTCRPASPIEYCDYFRKRESKEGKQTNSHESIAQKMAQLHVQMKQETSLEWLPVYVVYDTSVLSKQLNVARELIFSRHFISVIPSFVLSAIDKMKTSSEGIRSAIRLIERAQKREKLQIVQSDTHEDCIRHLIASASKHGLTSHETIVALLVDDKEKFKDIEIPSLSLYDVVSFHERLAKAAASPSASFLHPS